MKKITKNKDFLTVIELADILGISRIAVFNKIKKRQIKAEKAGRNYIIRKKDIPDLLEEELTDKLKVEIKKSVRKVLREYGETIWKLGND